MNRGQEPLAGEVTVNSCKKTRLRVRCKLYGGAAFLGRSPGGEGAEGGAEAGRASLSTFPEGLLHQLGLRRGVHPPEGALPRLLLRPRHFDEVAVQGEVVPDGVLRSRTRKMSTVRRGKKFPMKNSECQRGTNN